MTGTYDLCLVKGAPEKLLPAADQYLDAEGKKAVLTGDMKKSLDETMVAMPRTPSACWDFSSVKGDCR